MAKKKKKCPGANFGNNDAVGDVKLGINFTAPYPPFWRVEPPCFQFFENYSKSIRDRRLQIIREKSSFKRSID